MGDKLSSEIFQGFSDTEAISVKAVLFLIFEKTGYICLYTNFKNIFTMTEMDGFSCWPGANLFVP